MSKIDWDKKVTPEDREAARLENWRSSQSCSRVQMTEALLALEILADEDEAEEFAGHDLPQSLEDMTNALPEDIRKKARRILKGENRFHRKGEIWGYSPFDDETVDALFEEAKKH